MMFFPLVLNMVYFFFQIYFIFKITGREKTVEIFYTNPSFEIFFFTSTEFIYFI